MRKIAWRPRAKLDKTSIAIYLGQECRKPEIALETIRKIDSTIKQICEFPELGRSIAYENLTHHDYRWILSGQYRIIYRFTDKTITIYRIIHQRQDIDEYALVNLF